VTAGSLGIGSDLGFGAALRDFEGSKADLSLVKSELVLLRTALETAAWNQSQACRLLQISRDALRYKMKKFNVRPPLVQ
jgi:DNA-binding protein Fis